MLLTAIVGVPVVVGLLCLFARPRGLSEFLNRQYHSGSAMKFQNAECRMQNAEQRGSRSFDSSCFMLHASFWRTPCF